MKVFIIGGGAAGFFSAINIATQNKNAEVTIFEKTSQVLSKVKVSGGGRCNVTHACFEPKELIENYPRGNKELLGPFHHFMTGDTIEWFSNRGVNLKMEEDGRMFPESDSSSTIINCFLNEVNRLNIKVLKRHKITKIKKQKQFKLTTEKQGDFSCDYLVIAAGGNSKLKHYELYKSLGHKIIPPIPSLYTFNLPKHSSNKLMGLAIPADVKIVGTNYEAYGPVLFTHWGMSGPGILKLSSIAAQYLNDQSYQFKFEVCWLDNATQLIENCRITKSKQMVKNIKIEDFPNRFTAYLLNRSSIDLSKNWADLNKTEIKNLTDTLESDIYKADGKTTFKEEFVTCGGIDLKEINMNTLESKLASNLFFCGEVMNIDAVTGGFNFQSAWTSGYLVAKEVARRIE